MANSQETNVNLKINRVPDKATLENMVANNQIQPNQLYILPSESGGTTYGWVGATTSISSTPSTSTVTVDMSQLITDYDTNGEYELLLELTISIGSNVDIGIYLSSDIITNEYNACRSRGLTGSSCIIPIKKYLYYRNNNSSMSSYITLKGYRRIK